MNDKIAKIILVIGFVTSSINSAHAQVESFQLENGIRVFVNTIPEASDVAMEASYDVGFIDEPKGMVQASHLLEHLVCYSPGADFEMFEAMEWLNQVGSGNAETLPDFTHYDYVVPAEDFEKVVQLEAARLTNASFDRDLIKRECKRVYQETDFVEQNPATGMLKHAMMACVHAWKYQAKEALVRGGMEEFEIEQLQNFYKEFYEPRKLTLAISGNITSDDAKKLLDKHLGSIPSPGDAKQTSIDWSKLPASHTVKWDAKLSAVCIAWESPKDRAEQVVLSLASALAMQKLMQEPELKKECHIVFCTNNLWNCSDIPVFAYAAMKDGADGDKVADLLENRYRELLPKNAKTALMQSKMMIKQAQNLRATWPQVQQMQKMLTGQGRTEQQAIQLVLLQDALNRVISDRLFGPEPDAVLKRIEEMDEQTVIELIARTIADGKGRVVKIEPMKR